MVAIVHTKIKEFQSERSGKRRVTYTFTTDEGHIHEIANVLEPNEVDIQKKADKLAEKVLKDIAQEERDKAYGWIELGLNPLNYPFKYNSKLEVMQEMYDKELPEEQRISARLSKFTNARNLIATFLGLNN